ncbi:MAG: 50S ribosomal protein L3 [Candidatus Moeniiplasma glomeromycotorum]|nr:50S ribosomal protein L3 [Candidatus Moeniiplasma glomeromycotorum]MCE8168082.1 50S ribosomal protein L3 [Candidatus Moeniiplasma glomeromycotorum]MCE8169609.1 50S ribosomal protein L3 [Candidatus Moeniiplasma glomeromycotorum]
MSAVGILVEKMQMTQIPVRGELVGVTPVGARGNVVSQVKTEAKEGYQSCQVAFEDCREKILNQCELGHLKKKNISPKKHLREIRDMKGFEVGSQVDLALFQEGEKVKITGTSKGKGFAGVIKRYHFGRGRMSHGGGPVHRHMGSATGGRGTNQGIPKGKKMPGRMGGQKTTQLSVIEKIDLENQIIFVRGAVPGPVRGLIILRKK